MNDHAAEFRRCLCECDVVAIRKLSKYVSPHLTQPASDQEAIATIHYARTQSVWMDLHFRLYSHNWLIDHELPSGLPDELRPRVERVHPRVVEGVGIAVKTNSELMRPAGKLIAKAMSDAVMDAYAEGNKDPSFVKYRILEAREREITKLLGKLKC